LFPVGDENPASRRPVVNHTLIALNGLVFLWLSVVRGEGFFDPTREDLLRWGLLPGELTPERFLASLFIHAGPLHLLGNMWFLHIFGDNVEDKMGRGKYLLFYLAWGVAASLAFLRFGNPAADKPLVGASGSIAGVMGAYLVLFPRARIRMVVLLFVFFYSFVWPAIFVIGLYFLQDLALGVLVGTRSEGGGIAYVAHTGGMLAGVVTALLLKPWLRLPADGNAWDRDTGFAAHDGPRTIPLPDLRDQLVGAVLDGRMDLALELHRRWSGMPRGEALPPGVEIEIAHEIFRRGRVEEAGEAYHRFLADHPGTPDAAEAKFRLGLIHLRATGDRAKAREWLRQAAAEHPDPETAAFARRELGRL
jgi:membrane associated rhomboid family serine protease